MSSTFDKLYQIDCSEWIEKKNNLSYLSWANAWAKFKHEYPDANYEIVMFNGLPYIASELGIMCCTKVTVEGLTHMMWLPVMDSANRALRTAPYTYRVWNSKLNKFEDKVVKAADMFDVNKTLMRCLTKNLGMFGLGLSIYAGEDIPQPLDEAEARGLQSQIQDNNKKKHVSFEMFQAGQCEKVITFLVGKYNKEAGKIPDEDLMEAKDRCSWDPAAWDSIVKEAERRAFVADLQDI